MDKEKSEPPEVYTHQGGIAARTKEGIDGVTAVILAGGGSTRMKSNKALLPCCGELFIQRIHRKLAGMFPEIILVTNTPESYRFLPCRTVPDIFPGMGSLAGLHSGLSHSPTPYIFVVACDMPYLNERLIARLVERINGQDVIIPESAGGLEPLHAVYGKGCLKTMEEALLQGRRRIVDCLKGQNVTLITKEEVSGIDPEFLSFSNINTPEEYFRFRDGMFIGGEEDLRGTMPCDSRRT